MTESFFILLLISGLRLTLPLLFAALGGYFSEKSGVAQIALEGFMLTGAFTAASIGFYSHSILLSLLAAAVLAALMAQIFLVLVLKWKVNSIIAGTGINLLVMGLIPITSKVLFNSTGSTPSHDMSSSLSWWPTLLALLAVAVSYYLSEKTVWGLQFKFAGEKKEALASLGVSSTLRQWQAVSLGAALAGLGGSILSLSMASNYSPLMSAGSNSYLNECLLVSLVGRQIFLSRLLQLHRVLHSFTIKHIF